MATKTKAVTEKETVMYLGPTIAKQGLKTNTLYKGGIPERYNYSPLNRLFVGVSSIMKYKGELKRKETPIAIAYNEIINKKWSDD